MLLRPANEWFAELGTMGIIGIVTGTMEERSSLSRDRSMRIIVIVSIIAFLSSLWML